MNSDTSVKETVITFAIYLEYDLGWSGVQQNNGMKKELYRLSNGN